MAVMVLGQTQACWLLTSALKMLVCGKTLQQTIRSSFPDSSYGKDAVSPVFWKGL